jgi:hypothetical protein
VLLPIAQNHQRYIGAKISTAGRVLVNLQLASTTECVARWCVSKIAADPHFFIGFAKRQQSDPRNLAGVFEPPAKMKGALKKRVNAIGSVYGISRTRSAMIPAANAGKLHLPRPVQAIIPTHFVTLPSVHDFINVAALMLQTYIVENVLLNGEVSWRDGWRMPDAHHFANL